MSLDFGKKEYSITLKNMVLIKTKGIALDEDMQYAYINKAKASGFELSVKSKDGVYLIVRTTLFHTLILPLSYHNPTLTALP